MIGRFWFAIALMAMSSAAAAPCPQVHIVAPGERLTDIAERHLGSVFDTPPLFELNRSVIGATPSLLRAGMILGLPCGDDTQADDLSRLPDALTVVGIMSASDLQVIDIRAPELLEGGVLPRTLSLPATDLRMYDRQPVMAVRPVRASGVRLDRPVLVVGASGTPRDMGQAAYVYWVLKSLGAHQIAILSGGVQDWRAAGLPLAPEPLNTPSQAISTRPDTSWISDMSLLQAVADGRTRGVLLDARPSKSVARAGFLGRALAFTRAQVETSRLDKLFQRMSGTPRYDDGFDELLETLAAHKDEWRGLPIVSFSSAGELAALNWFFASEIAGLDNVRLYAGPVAGWAKDKDVRADIAD